MNRSEAVYTGNKIIAEFIGCDCYCNENSMDISEFDEDIQEIQNMLYHAIDIGDKKITAFWRTQLQKAKVEKRYFIKMIENKKKEFALT